jgi:cell division protein FtsB
MSRVNSSAYRWWLLPVLAIAVVGLFVAAFYPVAKVEYREVRQKTELQSELAAIKARNDRLRYDVASLRTPEGVEDYARLHLGMAKKGENVVIVNDGSEPTRTASVDATPQIDPQIVEKPPAGPWTAFLDAFFGVQ